MTELKPHLVIDKETGKLCMQVRLGSHTSTLPLPDEMASWKLTELEEYFKEVVPDMIIGLKAKAKEEAKKLRRKT